MAEIFINNKTNQTYKENEIITMPKLAKTLKIISEENVTAFYNGSLTQLIVDEINENGISIFLLNKNWLKSLKSISINQF